MLPYEAASYGGTQSREGAQSAGGRPQERGFGAAICKNQMAGDFIRCGPFFFLSGRIRSVAGVHRDLHLHLVKNCVHFY